MKIKYIFATIFFCCFAVSCQQPEIEALSEIKVSDTYLSIDVKGGSATLDITTNDAWEIDAQSVPEWLTITPTSGSAGDSKLTFSAAETKATNKAEVKLLCAGKTQYINVIQYAEKVEPKVMTVAEALEIIKPLGESKVADGLFRVKGIVCKITEISAQYGNATYYLSDDGSYKGSTKADANWIQVYRGLWLNGTAFTTGDEFAIGDELVIEGALMDYKGIPETQEKNAYVISITKSLIGIDKLELLGAVEGDGVSEFPLEGGAIKVTLKNKGNGFRISIPEAAKSWLHIADFGSDFVTLEAEANTGGDRDVAVSFSTEANGTTYSCEQAFTQKGAILAVTVADFNAASVGSTIYRVKAVISSIANAEKGRFYIKDYTGETYVYGYTGFAETGAKVGDIITIVGKRDQYNETIEMTSATIEEVTAVTEVSIEEFLAKDNSKEVYYMVSGTIDEIANDTYGNLYITDGTNRLYVYGCYPGYGATGDARKGWIATAGIEVGDKLTMIGYKDTYNGTIELCGGIYFSHEKAE